MYYEYDTGYYEQSVMDEFLEKIYSLFYNSYDFTYGEKILDMPYKYILQWVYDCKNDATRFIEKTKNVSQKNREKNF